MSSMAEKKEPWHNRIVGHAHVDPSELKPNRLNWRRHPTGQKDVLSALLGEVGWLQSVIVNQQTGNIVDGHLRVDLALHNREQFVPVVYVDLSPEEESLALATFDPISAMADADSVALEQLLQSVNTTEPVLQEMLANLAKVEIPALSDDLDDMFPVKKPRQIACPDCGSIFTV